MFSQKFQRGLAVEVVRAAGTVGGEQTGGTRLFAARRLAIKDLPGSKEDGHEQMIQGYCKASTASGAIE